MTVLRLFLAVVLGVSLSMKTASAMTVSTVTGKEITGQLETFDAAGGTLTLVTAEGTKETAKLNEIIEIFIAKPAAKALTDGLCVFLSNGDLLVGELAAAANETITLRNSLLGETEIPFETILEARLIRNFSRAELFKPVAREGKWDFIETTIASKNSRYDGVIEEVTMEGVSATIKISGTQRTLNFGWDKLASFGFAIEEYHKSEGVVAIVKSTDNTRLSGEVKEFTAKQIVLQTPLSDTGVVIPIHRIASVSFADVSFEFLSDLKPGAVTENYLFEDFAVKFPPRMDTSVVGGPISLKGRIYRKGIGMHADSSITFDLGEGYTRFKTDIGICDDVKELPNRGRYASAQFRVLLDGKEVFKSDTLTVGSPIQTVDLDITGGKSLTLEVLNADGNLAQDRANWAGALLLK